MAVRREKYRGVERKKCWDHHLRRQREKTEDMDAVVEESGRQLENFGDGAVAREPADGDGAVGEGEEGGGGEGAMETDAEKSKFSKKYLERLSKAWKCRRDKRKRKKLSNTKKKKW